MNVAVDRVALAGKMDLDHLLEIHAALMERSDRPDLGGRIRGVLHQIGGGQRYRLFEAGEVFDVLTGYERAMATESGDTAANARDVQCRNGRVAPPEPRRLAARHEGDVLNAVRGG